MGGELAHAPHGSTSHSENEHERLQESSDRILAVATLGATQASAAGYYGYGYGYGGYGYSSYGYTTYYSYDANDD